MILNRGWVARGVGFGTRLLTHTQNRICRKPGPSGAGLLPTHAMLLSGRYLGRRFLWESAVGAVIWTERVELNWKSPSWLSTHTLPNKRRKKGRKEVRISFSRLRYVGEQSGHPNI